MDPACLLKWVQILYYLAAAFAAAWAVWVYHTNSRRERSKWAESLYSRFFEEDNLKEIRHILDSEKGDPKVEEQCAKAERSASEGANFTDYLNFFELVAYLKESGQLKTKDVDALFSYYLCSLKKHDCVTAYIGKYGFKHLKNLLSEYDGKQR